jgi:hypothetical protein
MTKANNMTQGLEILKNYKSGKSTFSFTVKEERNRFQGTWFTVEIKQVTDCSDLNEDDFICYWKVVCPSSMTEHAAINFAGKKVIKNFEPLN